jgi:peptidoglycan/xylan/chitin deacetylase (PgdA/CDA1 family)
MVLLAATATALAMMLVVACGGNGGDEAGEQTTESTSEATTTVAPTTTTAPTTTVPPPTTSTTMPWQSWPRSPVKHLPASGSAPVISRVDTPDPVIFLTIDDGMIRDPRVPEFLAANHIPVALFINEGPLRADPDYFLRVIAAGGSINSHTRSHPRLTSLGATAQRNEICGMRGVIGEYVLAPGHLFRAPYGVSNAATQTAVTSCGINAILFWHASLNDGRVQLQQGSRLQPGDIVLSHFRADLYDNLVALVAKAYADGLAFARLDDYLPLP